jgi:hypothetical protein
MRIYKVKPAPANHGMNLLALRYGDPLRIVAAIIAVSEQRSNPFGLRGMPA